MTFEPPKQAYLKAGQADASLPKKTQVFLLTALFT
jgi:hypothetical protein